MFFQQNKWFDDNSVLLNHEKTQYVHFTPKVTVLHEALLGYNDSFISNCTSTKFLGVIIENTVSWKALIDHFYLRYVWHVIELEQLNLSLSSVIPVV